MSDALDIGRRNTGSRLGPLRRQIAHCRPDLIQSICIGSHCAQIDQLIAEQHMNHSQ
jgi:hypothetical protein